MTTLSSLLLFVCLFLYVSLSDSSAIPLYFDIGGINASELQPSSVKGIDFKQIFECPHPCGLVSTFINNSSIT